MHIRTIQATKVHKICTYIKMNSRLTDKNLYLPQKKRHKSGAVLAYIAGEWLITA